MLVVYNKQSSLKLIIFISLSVILLNINYLILQSYSSDDPNEVSPNYIKKSDLVVSISKPDIAWAPPLSSALKVSFELDAKFPFTDFSTSNIKSNCGASDEVGYIFPTPWLKKVSPHASVTPFTRISGYSQ